MPVTGLPNSDDWLQSLLANMGAGQPYTPGAQPSGAGPQGLMPGGGAMGAAATTPGQPSMGYPAMGQPQPGAAPAATPGTSLTSNPLTQAGQGAFGNIQNWLGAHMPHPSLASPAAAATADPRLGSSVTMGQPAAGMPSRPVTPTPGAGGASANMPYPGMVDPSGGYAPAAAPNLSNAPMPPARPRDLGQTAGVGAPQGSPSATPRPASSTRPNLGRYGTVQYQTPNSVGNRAPIYTALNLFGRG